MRRLTLEPRGSPGRLLGLEHEFRVLARGIQVDFRRLIHSLGLGQPNLDPADPNAYRLPSGAALTCDGREAEIALPPIAVRPGFGREVRSRAAAERRDLLRGLGPSLTLDGCSTHISVSAADEATQAICHLYATTFAPALMLLMDRRDSPGLLVRPRPGRVELGGEYVAGDQLGAATTFAVGSVLACERALRDPRQPLPPVLDVRLEPARARYGWYVDRQAFGGDLYATGRSTILTTRDDDRVGAQEVLERAWAAALAALDGLVETEDQRFIDALVSGRELLPCETTQQATATHEDNEASLEGGPGGDPFGSATRLRTLRVAEVAPVMLTWDLAVFVLLDRPRGRTAFAAVPRGELAAFLDELDAGRLDVQIQRFLARRRWSTSRLEAPHAVSTATLFDELGPRLGLVPAEYGPDGRPVAPLELLAGRAA